MKMFGRFNYSVYLCHENRYRMEEKKHPVFEEEESMGMVCEPVGAFAYSEPKTGSLTEPEDCIPVSSPSTWDEAMADLDSSESDILNGHGTPWAIVKQMMSDRIREYAR